jgi:signal transduction histidine kinase
MHKLLKYQLNQSFGRDFNIENADDNFKSFLQEINESYEDYEKEKRFIEHSLALNSKELYEANKAIKQHNKDLEEKVRSEVEKNRRKEIQLFEQAKMASMGEMIANIAHQWRQPLNAVSITSSAMLLKQECGILTDKEIEDSAEAIINHVDYLSKTIDTFRDFLKEKKELATIVLQERLELILNILRTALNDNHVTLNSNINQFEPITLKLVIGEIDQVIINIINNAIDIFKEKKILEPNIWFNLEKDKEHLLITIEDNGGGIPKNIISHIFEPYFTTKHKSQGTGLGLYMGYKIVTESLKGKLYVQNTTNGAKFFIEIPLNNQ